MGEYNKLVRDRIPEIIRANGQIPFTSTLSEDEVGSSLVIKLVEESAEFFASEEPEELADILEVVHSLARCYGISLGELERLRKSKEEERGSFNERTFLERVERDYTHGDLSKTVEIHPYYRFGPEGPEQEFVWRYGEKKIRRIFSHLESSLGKCPTDGDLLRIYEEVNWDKLRTNSGYRRSITNLIPPGIMIGKRFLEDYLNARGHIK